MSCINYVLLKEKPEIPGHTGKLRPHLNARYLLVVEKLIRSLHEMEVLVVMHSVVEILGLLGRFEEPSGRPRQLIAVIRALVILRGVAYRHVIKAAVSVGELVQIPGVLETLGAIFRIHVPEDNARGCERGRCFASEIGTYSRSVANVRYKINNMITSRC